MSVGPSLAFPFAVGADGRSRTAVTLADQVLQELEQLVLTNPGERLFLPDFGGGVNRLLFEGIDGNTGSIAQATLTQAIRYWLAGRADLQGVNVSTENSTISITILYQLAGATALIRAIFQRNTP